MATSIQLSLKGDGRLLRLTPQTVRAAFLRIVQVNRLSHERLRVFDDANMKAPQQAFTPLDRIFRRTEVAHQYLTASEILGVEHRLNRLLIDHSLKLMDEEGIIHDGLSFAQGAGLQQKRTQYVMRYGILFELSPISRDQLPSQPQLDIAVESSRRDVELMRFMQVRCTRAGLMLEFANRFNLKLRHATRLSDFDCRRLFQIRRATACEGFHLMHFR